MSGAPTGLLVTTGFELALERALEEIDESYDTVCYLASGLMRGSFCHILPGGQANVIERPNSTMPARCSDRPEAPAS